MKLTPVAYGCEVESIFLNVEAVNTHRDRPVFTQDKRLIRNKMQHGSYTERGAIRASERFPEAKITLLLPGNVMCLSM
ncbi:hypothetical protein QQF64_020518 [Cirrhinus molitorella]|uniref:Uncharacterized protein n=1 Tax=Cirrhinus molitorella TaxID=172907 RepID=A0ABR3LDC3_9TELE